MVELYVPTEIYLEGVTYPQGVQDVPDTVADFIKNDPVLSKVKPPKQVDKFRQFKHQSLSRLKQELTQYEDDLYQYEKRINNYHTMGAQVPKQLLLGYLLAKENYLEFKTYIAPIIESKELEEKERRAKIVSVARSKGARVVFDSEGNWNEIQDRKTVPIQNPVRKGS